jgi:N-methylhydantoinase B
MPSPDTLRGTFEQPPAKVGSMTVRDGDVFIFTGNGGGGVGDPLLREPDSVAFDVRNRYVTPDAAQTIYGVELDATGDVDHTGTERRRAKLRHERIGEPPRAVASTTGISGSVRRASGVWTCGYCSEPLGRATDNYRSATVVHEEDLAERHQRYDMHIRPRPDGTPRLVLRHHFCPACASAIVTDMTLAGDDVVMAPRDLPAD